MDKYSSKSCSCVRFKYLLIFIEFKDRRLPTIWDQLAAKCFQKKNHDLSKGIPGVNVFNGDILAGTKTRPEHDKKANKVVKIVRKFNVSFKNSSSATPKLNLMDL